MATRFYTDPTNAPTVSPAYGTWSDTTQAVRRKLIIDAPGDNTTTTFEVTETSLLDTWYVLVAQFVSEPLDSISATLPTCKIAFRCIESAAKSNANLISKYRKCDEDGSNPVDIDITKQETTEFEDDVLTNRYYSGNLDDQVFSQGDRLIFEIGAIFKNTKSTSYGGSINVTDNHATTDLPENDTETAAYNSWIETGDTFTEATGGAAIAPTSVIYGPLFGPLGGPI